MLVECFAPDHHHVQARTDGAATGGTWSRAGPADPALLVSHEELAREFTQHGLEVLHATQLEALLNEGSFHRGRAVLTQFVARRPGQDKVHCTGQDKVPWTGQDTAWEEVSHLAATAIDLAVQSVSAQVIPPEVMSASGPAPSVISMGLDRYHASMDAVFEQALQGSTVESTPAEFEQLASVAVDAHTRCGEQAGDLLLWTANSSVAIACGAAEAQSRCRYCWVPQRQCLCAALLKAAPPRMEGKAVLSSQVRVQWVILQHPNEFLRDVASAKLVPIVLRDGRCVCCCEMC